MSTKSLSFQSPKRPAFLLSVLSLAFMLVSGCGGRTTPVEGCTVPSYPNVNGLWMEIHPAYIEIYGCETFEDMTIQDFSNFCAQFQDGDGAISTDPDVLNCDEDSCEFYWVCDRGAPAR